MTILPILVGEPVEEGNERALGGGEAGTTCGLTDLISPHKRALGFWTSIEKPEFHDVFPFYQRSNALFNSHQCTPHAKKRSLPLMLGSFPTG